VLNANSTANSAKLNNSGPLQTRPAPHQAPTASSTSAIRAVPAGIIPGKIRLINQKQLWLILRILSPSLAPFLHIKHDPKYSPSYALHIPRSLLPPTPQHHAPTPPANPTSTTHRVLELVLGLPPSVRRPKTRLLLLQCPHTRPEVSSYPYLYWRLI
jgi:hypothetical protein